MAIKIRLPNGRFIKVDTDDMNVAQKTAAQYYNSGETGFVDNITQTMASESDKNNFDYESGVNAPWLRAKLGAMETQGGKERVLEEAVGGDGFTRNSKGDLALTPRGLRKLGIKPTSNKYVVIDESGLSFNDLADFSGIIGPIVGSIAGSIFTRGKLKPKFPGLKDVSIKQIGAISAGTGVGAAGGKGIEEGIEYVAGLQDNTPGELASLLATEAAIGAGGEALFGLGGKMLKYTFGQKALSKGKLGAEDLKMASAISKSGVVDSKTGKRYKGAVALAAMDSPLTGLLQGIAETVSNYQGRKIGVRNVLATDVKNVFRSTNDLTADFDKEIDDLIKTGFGDSAADVEAGKKLSASISRKFRESEKKLNTANSNVRKMMDDVLGDFDAFAESATTQAGDEIRTLTAQGYNAWYDAQSKLYESTGKFFEIPRNLSDDILSFEAFGGPGLGIQAKFIDSTPLKEYIRIIAGDALDASGKLNADKAGAQLADLQKLIDKTGQNLSLKELLELRSGLASANRITESSKEFASIASPDRSKLISIIDESLRRLEDGDDIAFNQLQQFFKQSKEQSIEGIEKNILKIENLNKVSNKNIYELVQDVASPVRSNQTNQDLLKKLLQNQPKEISEELGALRSSLTRAETELVKIMEDKNKYTDLVSKEFELTTFENQQNRRLLEETEIARRAKIEEIENIKNDFNQIQNRPDFVSLKQIAKKEADALQRENDYYNKVIDDITENKKIDTRKLKAQMQSIRIANDFYSKGMEAFDQGLYKNLLNDVAAGGLDVDKILTQVVMKKNNGDQIKRLFDTLDVDTAAFRKQRFKKIVDDKEVSTGRVDRSKAPTRSALEFSDTQRTILEDAEINVKDPVFKNKEQVKGILQKEFLRDIVTRVQKGSDIVNYKQIANTIEGYGTTADTLFGPTGKRELLKSLREADQFVNVGTVDELDDLLARTANVDNVIEDLTAKVAAQSELDEIAKLNVFKRIQNGTIDPENIVNTLFKSGNSEEIATVKQLLGPESVEFKEFQTAAMRKILNDYVNPGDDAIEKLFKEGKFYDAILSPSGYGQAVLKETFGDAQYELLKKAATRSKFLAGGEKISGTADLFTRGLMFKILSAPTRMLGQYSAIRFLAIALGSKRFSQWLAGEIPDKVFLKNDLPNLYQALGVGQPIRRSIGIQSITEPARETSEYAERQFKNQGIDPKSPIALDLPEIEPANLSAQNQTTPRSLNLLGGNMANLDIAQRIDRDIQRLV